MDERLTIKQAFKAMYAFLDDFYQRGKSDEIGNLLSGMSFLADGDTADPAAWSDWLEAVQKAVADEVDAELRITRNNS